MPRKHKRQRDDDQEFDHKETNSKWAAALNQVDDDEDELPQKTAYNYDFSKQHRLYNQKEVVRQEEPKIVLTPEQQAELDRKLEKQRVEKEEKERVKKEKKSEKKKLIQKEKEEERVKRQEDEKEEKELENMVSSKKGNSDSKKIILTMFVVLILLGLLQYQKDIYAKLSKFRITATVDFYQVLEVSGSASDAELKNQYKKLVVKYHPDKNPNCHSCKQKFNSIMEAWEVLGNPDKRKSYDQSTGFVTQIPSETITLTPDNYDWLVGDSSAIWLVQVYDSTNEYCHFFAKFWEQFAAKHKGFVNVGRIDVWQQSEMKSYVPYRFQIFPGLYTMHKGEERMCQFDFERPYRSLEICIEELLEVSPVVKINDWAQIPQSDKVAVILGGNVKPSLLVKMVHFSLTRYIDFYSMPSEKNTQVLVKGEDYLFNLTTAGSNKSIYTKYRHFLEGLIRQQKTECEIVYQCKERPCLLLLNPEHPPHQLLPFPLIEVTNKAEFTSKIDHIKNVTGLFERFDVGYYQDGKIELGYFNQIAELNPENGEVIDFVCRKQTILAKVISGYEYLAGQFS